MGSAAVEINNCYEAFKEEALRKNSSNVCLWTKYKSDLDVTKSLLTLLPKKVHHKVMVPVGSKALFLGKIVHTNEYLVNLGETWFCNRTACQAIDICDRRIKTCDEMLQKLEKERELIVNKSSLPVEQEAFGNEERPEIIEYVTEKENEDWNKEHRIREKKYRQQLAELRSKERGPIVSEEDLWKHLDELELQEELEDELNRLGAEDESEEEVTIQEDEENESYVRNLETSKKSLSEETKIKKKVSFTCDSESDSSEPLRLEITHSNIKPVLFDPNSEFINSPSDIFDKFLLSTNKSSLSILTNNTPKQEKCLEEDLDGPQEITIGLNLKDVVEKNSLKSTRFNTIETSKKISKFKASRMLQ